MSAQDSEDELVQLLIGAIHSGEIETAQNIVVQLANLRLKLKIDIVQDQIDALVEKPFKLKVQVEDREAAGASFDLQVRSTDKIGDLKKRVRLKFKCPEEVQRWIIGKRIQDDNCTLAKCNIHDDTTVFLYLLPAHSVGLIRPLHDVEGYEGDNLAHAKMDEDMHLYQNTSFGIEDSLNDINRKLLRIGSSKSSLLDAEEIRFDVDIPEFEKAGEPRYDFVQTDHESVEDSEYEPWEERHHAVLRIGDRVVWPSDSGHERGTVKWIGTLPDVEGNQLTVGIEFDNKIGHGNGEYKGKWLFSAKQDHVNLIPAHVLIKD